MNTGTYTVTRPDHADPKWRKGYTVQSASPQDAVVRALAERIGSTRSRDRIVMDCGDWFVMATSAGHPAPLAEVVKLN